MIEKFSLIGIFGSRKMLFELRNENEILKTELEKLKIESKNSSRNLGAISNVKFESLTNSKSLDSDENLKKEFKDLEKQHDYLEKNYIKLQKHINNNESLKNDYEEIRIENKDLKFDYYKLKHEYEILEKENIKLKEKQDYLEEKLSKNNKLGRRKSSNYDFSEEERIYNIYLSLEPHVLESLQGLFKNKGLKEFLAICVQYKSIESLFDYIQRCIMENKLENLEQLNEIINFCLERHNYIYNSPIYIRQDIKVGEIFDVSDHTKTPSSNNAGAISKVYLQGYKNTNLNKIIKKTVVQI